tara:strand:+ start:2875 stop:3423 length:549 start_codon:yes stop_codon:yes gene_type:complete
MINKEKYFYLNSIQDIDIDYIKKTRAKLIIRDKRKYKFQEYYRFINKCKKNRITVYIANNLKLLFKLRLNKFYISSVNKKKYQWIKKINTNIEIIGSAHNLQEIIEKKNQGCTKIILSRLFKTEKPGYLEIIRFNILSLKSNSNYIALGGINKRNYKKLNMTNTLGFASLKELFNKPDYLKG